MLKKIIKISCARQSAGYFWLIYLLMIGLPNSQAADDSTLDLAKKAQNPVENMITIPLINYVNFNFNHRAGTQYNPQLKPVIPFALNPHWNLITRTIVPNNAQPNLIPGRHSIVGIGDINPTFFISPNKQKGLLWGIGPTVIFPTASNTQLGQGKYSLGPSLVMLVRPGSWVIGFLVFNVWSVGGVPYRRSVNELSLQYFINYNLSHGWYLVSSPIITANWLSNANNRWTIPVGGGIGRIFYIAKQALNVSVQAYDNIKSPLIGGANWQFQFNITLLFPEKNNSSH